MASLKIQGVNKSFGDIHALQDINLEVQDGEFFVLLGKTGAGKTTLLRAASGLENPDSGEVLINNDVEELTVDRPEILTNVNTPEDYEKVKSSIES